MNSQNYCCGHSSSFKIPVNKLNGNIFQMLNASITLYCIKYEIKG